MKSLFETRVFLPDFHDQPSRERARDGDSNPSARLKLHGLPRIPVRAWEGLNVGSDLSVHVAS